MRIQLSALRKNFTQLAKFHLRSVTYQASSKRVDGCPLLSSNGVRSNRISNVFLDRDYSLVRYAEGETPTEFLKSVAKCC
jgi:hypothetical protein